VIKTTRVTSDPTTDTGARARAYRVVELLWCDPSYAARIRQHPRFAEHIELMDEREADFDLDAAASTNAAASREAFEVLANAPVAQASELTRIMREASIGRTKLAPPLLLLEGELALALDDFALLQATLELASADAPDDKTLDESLKSVREVLNKGLKTGPLVAELRQQVVDAYGRKRRLLPRGELEQYAEQRVMQEHKLAKRFVFGAQHLRALLCPASAHPRAEPTHLPTYFPVGCAERMPLFARFEARLIAELNLAQDQRDAHCHPNALRGVALARVMSVSLPGATKGGKP